MNKKLLLKTLIIFSFLFIFSSYALACTIGEKKTESCTSDTEYRCEKNETAEDACDGKILRRSCPRQQDCNCIDDGSGGGTWDCDPCDRTGGCGVSGIEENCDTWEVCTGGTGWDETRSNYKCECKGRCLDDPANPRLWDGLGQINPPNTNVRLPVKFVWDQVPGANSYWYRAWKIDPPTTMLWENAQATTSGMINNGPNAKTSGISENPVWVIPESGNVTPCFLKLPETSTYLQSTSTNWKIAPCCNTDGTECKNWNEVSMSFFELSLAPQLISPEDLDWNGTAEMAEDVTIPITLSWCNIKEEDYYALKIYDADGNCHPFLKQGGVCSFQKVEKPSSHPYEKEIIDFKDRSFLSYFNSDADYKWEVSACHKAGGKDVCSSSSQQWQLSTESLAPKEFSLLSPQNQTTDSIGFPIILSWQGKIGINSFKLNIGGAWKTLPLGQTSLSLSHDELNLNQIYNWNIQGCFDYNAQNCGPLSVNGPWSFKTTGAAPTLTYPNDDIINPVVIPVNFDWDNIGGAKSYKIEILDSTCNSFSPKKEHLAFSSQYSIDYPGLEMNNVYCWKVQTCADELGNKCGLFSGTRKFKTFELGKPVLISPSGTINNPAKLDFSWNPVIGAKFYKYVITYLPLAAPPKEIASNTISSNNVSFPSMMFPENGNYEWKVQSCMDSYCNVGKWSDNMSFVLDLTATPEQSKGLVPCARKYDNPNTPWSEREPCQIKHFFFMALNILDFILWKVATLFIVLILLAIAGLFFASKGEATVMQYVKRVFRTSIIGYLIIFGAWFFISLIMLLLGYQVEFFGRWWSLPL